MASEKVDMIRLIILATADRDEAIEAKEFTKKVGVAVKRNILDELAADGLLEKVPKLTKSGKPSKTFLYRTSRKGIKQYKSMLNRFISSRIEDRLAELSRAYESGRKQILEILNDLEVRIKRLSEMSREIPASAPHIDRDSFLRVLESTYMELLPRSQMSPMVKISDLRRKIMANLGITREEFDRELISLHEEDPYKIQLSSGAGSVEEGLETRRGVYHYVLIK